MAAIFSAIDVSGISASVTTILVALIGVSVLFLGYRYAKKALARG